MRSFARAVLALALLGATAHSVAADHDSEITVFGAYRFGGTFNVKDTAESYAWQDSPGFGLIWDRRDSANTQWEVFFSHQQTEAEFSGVTTADRGVDVETTLLQLGGTYLWEQGKSAQPYLAATIGGTRIRVDANGSKSDTFISGSIGLGVKVMPNARLGLRFEARAHGVLIRESTDLFCRTGPDLNVCAIEVAGDLFTQIEAFAGIVLRF